jgi:hypothetical protein
MSAASRRQRGNDAARWYAEYCRGRGWAHAEATGAGRGGVDVTGMPGLSVEVKATAEMRLESWLAAAEARPGLPYAVWMAPGMGRARVAGWPVIMRRSRFWELVKDARAGFQVIRGTADTVDVASWAAGAAPGRVLEYRGRGADVAMRDRWPMICTVDDHVWMLGRAGYGGPGAVRAAG